MMRTTPTRFVSKRPIRRRLPLEAAGALIIAFACMFADAGGQPPLSMPHIVRLLSDEARQSKVDGVLKRSSASFASDEAFGNSTAPPQTAVLDRILRRNHTDAFTDAYIRWQLTSFNPMIEISRMADREFDRLVQVLPSVLPNPRADDALIEAFQRAAGLGTLTEQQQKDVNDRLNALARLSSAAEAFNVPGRELHEWLVQQFASQPHRVLTLMLHRAQSLAQTGWPVEDIKRTIDAQIARFASQREFTIDQRRAIALTAERMMVRPRMYLETAGVSEGAAYVNFNTTGIFDYDVRRWARALADEQ